jgi:hypothetical protein
MNFLSNSLYTKWLGLFSTQIYTDSGSPNEPMTLYEVIINFYDLDAKYDSRNSDRNTDLIKGKLYRYSTRIQIIDFFRLKATGNYLIEYCSEHDIPFVLLSKEEAIRRKKL